MYAHCHETGHFSLDVGFSSHAGTDWVRQDLPPHALVTRATKESISLAPTWSTVWDRLGGNYRLSSEEGVDFFLPPQARAGRHWKAPTSFMS